MLKKGMSRDEFMEEQKRFKETHGEMFTAEEKKVMQAAFRDLVEQFNRNRSLWVKRFGSDEGFNDWFTAQVMKKGQEVMA